MAATVLINEKNGAGGAKTAKNGAIVQYKAADNAIVDANDPLDIPASQRTYSYEKYLLAEVTVAPDTNIVDLEFFTDGSSGWPVQVNAYAKAQAAYVQPAVPPIGTTPPAGMVDIFTYTSASPLALGAGPFVGTGDIGDHVVSAMEVLPGAASGTLAQEGWTFRWLEI